MFGGLITLVTDMETQQFEFLHRQLRKLIVLSGARDHVSDFRQRIYWNVVDNVPGIKQQYPNISSFLSALEEEFKEFKARRIQARPLNGMFYAAVERLGLTRREWQQLKVISTDSVAAFHRKFTLEELQHEVFPPELEACRAVLVKAARKVAELNNLAQGAVADDDDDDGFF
ncbi:hypothetical protein GPECTOR_3g270 [Gonium pectorale]|uniref:Uncharacterized protein n=1 Tax=Gonium pectorale TaxID=33097 RepID=A0A150GZS1_GONPE|nr:hypothetical protein GPECTOR_3g270 [Gonium pectorale]|eukprot:KXZ55118.1 hypothetical protein GPECTOR_3g270 [Gonium pectorale]